MVNRQERIDKSSVYSWSTKVDFTLDCDCGFKDFDGTKAPLPWETDYPILLEQRTLHPQLEAAGASAYRLTIVGTQTATEAENLGIRVAYSLLRVAIKSNWGLSLSWQDTPLPCRVVDRSASLGLSSEAFGTVDRRVTIATLCKSLDETFSKNGELPYSLLLSMELCASSSRESDTRARLIMRVSALEALALQKDLSDELGSLIEKLESVVKEDELQDHNLKNSILGQVKNLKRESIRRSLRRLLADNGLTQDDVSFVESAYDARSKIVHEGQRVPELDPMNSRLLAILQRLYGIDR